MLSTEHLISKTQLYSMIEVTFLGTVSGVPLPNRNHSGIHLKYEDQSFLWDCGEGTQKQMFKAKLNIMKLDRIFITHWHADHWAGLIGLLQTLNLEKRDRPIEIYGPEAERFISDILDMDYWGVRFEIIPKNVPFRGSDITTLVKDDRFEISSIPVKHSVPAVAYCFKEKDKVNVDIKKAEKLFGLKQGPLVGKLKNKGEVIINGKKVKLEDVAICKKGVKVVFSGDTKPTPNMVKLGEAADLMIHESTFGDEFVDYEDRYHTKAEDAANTAKDAGAKNLVLTHFSRRYQDLSPLLEQAKKVFPNTELARDFLKINVK